MKKRKYILLFFLPYLVSMVLFLQKAQAVYCPNPGSNNVCTNYQANTCSGTGTGCDTYTHSWTGYNCSDIACSQNCTEVGLPDPAPVFQSCCPCGVGPPPIPPTVTPIPCIVPAAPVNLAPDAVEFPNTGIYSLTWAPVAGATAYAIRIDDLNSGWCDPPTTECYSPVYPKCTKFPGDFCEDTVVLTNFTPAYPFEAGHVYRWWVNAINSCGWGPQSALASVLITYISPTPAPTIPMQNQRTIKLHFLNVATGEVDESDSQTLRFPTCAPNYQQQYWKGNTCVAPWNELEYYSSFGTDLIYGFQNFMKSFHFGK